MKVNRRGKNEEFDERKVYASCYASCIQAHRSKEEAERTCDRVSNEINVWKKDKESAKSDDLFQEIIKVLRDCDTEAAFLFETHREGF